MEQPNVTGDGDTALALRFWAMVVAAGIATGLLGDLMMVILFTMEHLAFGYHAGGFQARVGQARGHARRARGRRARSGNYLVWGSS